MAPASAITGKCARRRRGVVLARLGALAVEADQEADQHGD